MRVLYHADSSVCSQKARLALAEIGLDWDSRQLDLRRGDQFAPEYLPLNPNAVVPTLVDDGLVVIESSLILEYLDRRYNDGALMPQDEAAGIQARLWLLRCLAIHAAINTLSFATVLRHRFTAGKTPEQIETMLAQMPDPLARAKRRDLFANGLASLHVGAALRELRRMLVDMDKALGAGDWVTGPDFGIADIAVVAYVERLDRLGLAGMWATDHPRVGAWLDRMRARPSWAVAISPYDHPEQLGAMRRDGGAAWPELRDGWAATLDRAG